MTTESEQWELQAFSLHPSASGKGEVYLEGLPACPEVVGMGAEAGWRELRTEAVKKKNKPSKSIWRLWLEINDKDLFKVLYPGNITRQNPRNVSEEERKVKSL